MPSFTMPTFNLVTIERWTHRVEYYGIEADTAEQAYEAILAGEIPADDHDVLGGDDTVLRVESCTDNEGNALAIPAAAAADRADHVPELLRLLRGLLDTARVVDVGNKTTFGPNCCGFAPELFSQCQDALDRMDAAPPDANAIDGPDPRD